jgi:hypothetical protein
MTFQLLGDVLRLSSLQPHDSYVVAVGNDCGNSASLTVERLWVPGLGGEVLNEVKADPVVRVESVQ